MDFNKHKKNNYLNKKNFENEEKPNVEDKEILTNIEAFELGKFPDNLVDKVTQLNYQEICLIQMLQY